MLAKRIRESYLRLQRREYWTYKNLQHTWKGVFRAAAYRGKAFSLKFIILHPNRRCLVEDRRLFREKSVWRTRVFCFLDELAEFDKAVLEVLRQPLESKEIRLIRTQDTYVYPADFILVGAMNPCPCGCYPDLNNVYANSDTNYLSRIKQPFWNCRIDICIEVPKVTWIFTWRTIYAKRARLGQDAKADLCSKRDTKAAISKKCLWCECTVGAGRHEQILWSWKHRRKTNGTGVSGIWNDSKNIS